MCVKSVTGSQETRAETSARLRQKVSALCSFGPTTLSITILPIFSRAAISKSYLSNFPSSCYTVFFSVFLYYYIVLIGSLPPKILPYSLEVAGSHFALSKAFHANLETETEIKSKENFAHVQILQKIYANSILKRESNEIMNSRQNIS
jgi:hypothetical protein